MKNGWDKTPKHQLCCCCCTWKSICCIWETFRLAVLSVTSFSLLLSPNGFKKLGQWKSQRGTTSRFGHTTIYKVFFFFRHKTFLPLFFSSSLSFCVCVLASGQCLLWRQTLPLVRDACLTHAGSNSKRFVLSTGLRIVFGFPFVVLTSRWVPSFHSKNTQTTPRHVTAAATSC